MTKRYTEGKLSLLDLSAPGSQDRDLNDLGVISDLQDFLAKVDRLKGEVNPPINSLREQNIANIRYWTSHVRRFLAQPESQSPVAQSALLHLMHASMVYVHLMNELADDEPSTKASSKRLTRGQYLEFRTKAGDSRKKLAGLCGMSLTALVKWEDENSMPRPRRLPNKRKS